MNLTNKFYLWLLASSMSLAVVAQSKLDVQSQLELIRERNAGLHPFDNRVGQKKVQAMNASNYKAGMIVLEDVAGIQSLEEKGVQVLRVRENIAIVSMPVDSIQAIAALDCVRKIELARELSQKMDKVREATGVALIHEGTGLPQAYTGKGVVTGICDSGLDPNHINFRDKNGKSRIGYISKITQSNSTSTGYVYENYYPKDKIPSGQKNVYAIEDFKTDSKETFHGTHTMGIMAGGYKGEIVAAYTADDKTAKNVYTANPYYGCATESEIVASCGSLYDAFIALGIEDCINYAKYSNGTDSNGNPVAPKPCVINISLGSSLGSHDPKSTMNSYLSSMGKEAIICVAAGNEGDQPIALSKQFTESDATLQSFIRPIYEGVYDTGSKKYYNVRSGQIYAYSGDDSEFEIQLVIFNKKRGTIAYRMVVESSTDGTAQTWCSGGDYEIDGATQHSTFKNAFDGYVAIGTMMDTETGRYYAVAEFFTSDNQTKNADGNYVLGLVVKGKDGKTVNVYGDANFTYFDNFGYGAKGWVNGSYDGTISDMAVANNILTVGSYNTRDHWASLDGGVYGYNQNEYPEGEVTSFSSYGTMPDGTTRPHVCAPGASVISSVNTYYVENPYIEYTDMALQAKMEESGRTNYWHQSLGTSMATPVVAGAIALWLEADPSLTIADVKDIVNQTAVVDWGVKSDLPAKWGAGKFNAYAGLLEVLRRKAEREGDGDAESDQKEIVTSIGSMHYNVFKAGSRQMDVRLYNMNGMQMAQYQATGDEIAFRVRGLQQGVYLMRVNGGKATKIILK